MGAYEYEAPLHEFDTASCSGESSASSITCSVLSEVSLSPHNLNRCRVKPHPQKFNNQDALNSERWSGSSTLITMESSPSPSTSSNNSPTKSPSKKTKAWKLREQWKRRGYDSIPQVPRRMGSERRMCSNSQSPNKTIKAPAVPPLFRNELSRWDSMPLSDSTTTSSVESDEQRSILKVDRRTLMSPSSSKRRVNQGVSRKKSLSPSPSSNKGKVNLVAAEPTKRYPNSRRKLLRKRHSERCIRRSFNDVLSCIVEVDNEDSFKMSPIVETRKKPMYERRSCPDLIIDRAIETVSRGAKSKSKSTTLAFHRSISLEPSTTQIDNNENEVVQQQISQNRRSCWNNGGSRHLVMGQ